VRQSVSPPAGKVSRPDRDLTPGAVALRDPNKVCASPLRQHSHVPKPISSQVFAEYGLYPPPLGNATSYYELDYLVPLALGGSTDASNVWPASISGIGFSQKQQLTTRLRQLVCQSKLTLKFVQHQIEVDWYPLWVTYVLDGQS